MTEHVNKSRKSAFLTGQAVAPPGRARRIALISEHASPLADPGSVDSGGQNVYVAQVARHLARRGYQVDVFTRRDDDNLPGILAWEDGVRVIHVPAGPAQFVRKEELLPHMQAFAAFMIEFCRRQGEPYDLIHANFWMSGWVAAEVKRALGIPFVVTFHALGRVRRIHQGKEDEFPDQRFEIEDQVVAEADRIIAECPQDQQDLMGLYQADPAKIVVAPCGFDPQEMWPLEKQAARQALGLPDDEWVVLQVGRMVPRKGVETAVRGFAHLVKKHSLKARMLVVGGGSEEPDPLITPEIGRLQAIAAEEGVADRVTFVGRRGRADLKHYYSAADVFVSTPWYEPFGITPVEAMACATPVIGSQVGGIKYTVQDGETGFLVPPNNPEVVGERLAYLFHHPDVLERLSRQALQRAQALFTWEKVCNLLAEVYDELAVESQAAETFKGEISEAGQPEEELSEAVLVGIAQSGGGLVPSAAPGAAQSDPVEALQWSFAAAIQALEKSRQVLLPSILSSAQRIAACLQRGNKVMVCGNGGSAADAQHFAAEFVGRFMEPHRRGLPVMALTADSAFLTAWSNDVEYDQVFARQVEAFGQPGDLLLGISTSGRSRNLIEAFIAARRSGIGCLALLGGDGGDLLPLADEAIVVPAASPPRIQEVQILVLHLLCELVESQFGSGAYPTGEALPAGEYLRVPAKVQPPWEYPARGISIPFQRPE